MYRSNANAMEGTISPNMGTVSPPSSLLIPASGRSLSLVMSDTVVWRPRQQFAILLGSKAPTEVMDSLIIVGKARTSTGTPVTSPAVRWNLRDSSGVNLVKSGAYTALMYPMDIKTTRTTWLVGTWTTQSGAFKDSVQVTLMPNQGAPIVGNGDPNKGVPMWAKGQQLMIIPTWRFLMHPTIITVGDTMRFTAVARTSTCVPVSNITFMWQIRGNSTGLSLFAPTAISVIIGINLTPSDSGHIVWLKAAWVTKSGIFRDSTKVFITPITLAYTEAARDSFPPATAHKFTLADGWGYKINKYTRDSMLSMNLRSKKTLTDSAIERNLWATIDTMPDSAYIQQFTPDTLRMRLGYQHRLCYMGKNRYNQEITFWIPRDSAGKARCNDALNLFRASP